MKKSLLLVAGTVFTLSLRAQITLNHSNAPSNAQCQLDDTLGRLKLNSLPDLSIKTNATWDLSATVDSGLFFTYNGAASSSAFPNAKFTISNKYLFSALNYESLSMKNVAVNGILEYGEHIDRQALPIGALTGDNGDSLVFLTQDITYNPTETELKYPCTMGTTWTDVNSFVTAFNLTVALYSLNKTPGERRTVRTDKRTVKGWGKMKVKDKNGNTTGYMDVLQMDIERQVKDSFYLAGSPAPASLLTAFGLSQGQVLPEYFRYFYRAGEYRPLLRVEYTDNTFTTIKSAHTHRQRLAPTTVGEIPADDIRIYPNPVTGGRFIIDIPGKQSGFDYQLLNMTGQVVVQGYVPPSGIVVLNDAVPAGIYLLKLHTKEGAYGVQRINIVK